MVIKPNLGSRIFWGVAGAILIITGCAGLTVPLPGLILTCLGLPLAVFAFGYTFGAAQTQVDKNGIFQRNFFFLKKKFEWKDIESGKVETSSYNHTDSNGWTERRNRTHLRLTSDGKKLYINARGSGPENWWADLLKMVRDKLGEKFEN